jgi:hypothetical protein
VGVQGEIRPTTPAQADDQGPVARDVRTDISSSDLKLLVPVLHDQLPVILDEVRERLRPDWPDYAAFLDHEQGEVTTAARAFLTWLVELAEQPDRASVDADAAARHIAVFEGIGRVESREGRDLSSLLSAYQVGGRVAWRHVSRAALELGVDPVALAALAEAVFAFLDQLSSASARGFVWEQSETVAERERLREQLVDMLLSGRAEAPAMRGTAIRVGWTPPAEAAVVLIAPDNPIGHTFLSRLDTRSLPIRRSGLVGAVVPDPAAPGRRGRLIRALRGAGAVIGHTVALPQLPASVSIAQTAAELLRAGVLIDDPVFADEHLDAILVHRDPQLLAAVQRKVLAPLDAETPASRERLTETLRSWLRHFGDRRAVANELHVHPQTVRYRMGLLHALFGSTLDLPDARARLLLALGWSRPAAELLDRAVAPNRAAIASQRTEGQRSSNRRQLPPNRPASRR